MGVYSNTQIALDTKLNEISGSPSIAWPNTAFTVTQGTTYLEPYLLSVNQNLLTLANYKQYDGIYQIGISVPLEKGTATLNMWVDRINTLFESDRELLQGSDRVFIKNINRGPVMRDTSNRVEYYRTFVDINFTVYS